MIKETLQNLLQDDKNIYRQMIEAIMHNTSDMQEMTDEDFAVLAKVSLNDLQSFLKDLQMESVAKLITTYNKESSFVVSKKTLFTRHTSLSENIEELTEKKLQTIRDTTLHLGQDRLREVADAIQKSNRIYVYAQGETRPLAHYLRTTLKTLNYNVILTDENFIQDYQADAKDLFIFLSIQGISFKENPAIMTNINAIKARKWLITCNQDINFNGNRWVIPVKDVMYSEFAMQHALDLLIALSKDLYEKGN